MEMVKGATKMKPDKQKRLEDKGWKTGSAEEFLGLTPEESAQIDSKLIAKQFWKDYAYSSPWRQWINMVGISVVGLQDKDCPESEKNTECLTVELVKRMPKKYRRQIPDTYEGLRVFVKIIGVIKPL